MQEGSSSLVRNWICWGTIAGAFLVAIALSHLIVAQFEQMVLGMGFDLPPDPGLRPRPHDWLIATSVGVVALFLAACLTKCGRVSLGIKQSLAGRSTHGAVYLEAFALWAGIEAAILAAIYVRWCWPLMYSSWFAPLIAIAYVLARCGSIRIPLTEWGWRGGGDLWRELAIGLVAGVVLRSIRFLPQAALDSGDSVVILASGGALAILSSVIVTPTLEETLHRGALYRYLRDRLHWPIAVLISASVFACAHTPMSRWPFVFVGGLGYALLREWRGSLVAPLAAHAVSNLLAALSSEGV